MKSKVIVVVSDGIVQEVHSTDEQLVIAVLYGNHQEEVELHKTGRIDAERDAAWIATIEQDEAGWDEWLNERNWE